MGTTYSIIVVHPVEKIDYQVLQNNIDSLLKNYNNYFSTYIDESEVSRLNKNKSRSYIDISSKLYNLFLKSINITNETYGAFDITVTPLVELWGFGSSLDENFIIPDSINIDNALKLVGSNKYVVSDGKIIKKESGVKFDFSAIAKGAGIDMLADYLQSLKIHRYMIEIGGEIIVSGLNKSNSNWNIGIKNPDKLNEKLIETISISDVAVATSGTYENYFYLDSIKYSHIIDPHNGLPIRHELVSVTVLAETATYADALATGFMVMGYDKALNWANSNQDVECYLVAQNNDGGLFAGYSDSFPIAND